MKRWRIERDYQALKQEIGLGHYEGHGWRGFLVAERAAHPRQNTAPHSSKRLRFPGPINQGELPIRPGWRVPYRDTRIVVKRY